MLLKPRFGSSPADGITGQLLVIDGGNHLNVSEPLTLRRR
jgi:hypothetical protein